MVRRLGAAINGRELARLRRRLQGQMLLPGQGGYDQARRVWNAMVDRHPALIARCASPADVWVLGADQDDTVHLAPRCRPAPTQPARGVPLPGGPEPQTSPDGPGERL